MAKTITNTEVDTVISYMAVSLGYDFNIVLPYKDGIAFLAAIEKSEPIERFYSSGPITFIDSRPTTTMLTVSQKEYREQKMIKLLGVQDAPESE